MNDALHQHRPPILRVEIRAPTGQSYVAELNASEAVSIGRESGCVVPLDSPLVSRRHALLEMVGDRVRLTDLSVNGTIVDGLLVQRNTVELRSDALVQVGPYLLRVSPEAGAPEPIAEPTAPPGPPGQSAAGTREVPAAVRREIHRKLLDHLDLAMLERSRMNPQMMRAKVRVALEVIISDHLHLLPSGIDTAALIDELTDEAVGLGPLEKLLADPSVSEIMVTDPGTIYIERRGRIEVTEDRFTDEESARSIIERIVTPLGRRIDESSPMLDARLPDGSRVNAVIGPVAIRGTCITIRKFSKEPFTSADLLGFGSLNERMVRFLDRSVKARKNIVIAGGTASGKTTLLNVLSGSIPDSERVVTIEDSAELRLTQSHVISLEARPPNMEGRGEITIRDLVRNAMRMRPDRVIVGECRGGEALDMLQAMNTGHDGSMTTTHANSPLEALKRIETLALMSGIDLPARAIREQIALAVDLLVHQARFADGSRRVTSITEVIGLDDDGDFEIREIFGFRRTRTGDDGKVIGDFYTTGYLPSYLEELVRLGLIREGEGYL